MRLRGWGTKLGSLRDHPPPTAYKGAGVSREPWVLLFIH